MAARFTWDYAGGREMLNSDEMVAEMHLRAERVAEAARAISPISDEADQHYIDSFEVSSGKNGGLNHDRAYGRVTNTSDHAAYIEFGTEDTPEFAVLRRALDSA